MSVTILICTYNRGNLVHGALESLIRDQEQKPDEIVVVNGGGENDCASAVGHWQKEFPALKHIRTKNINLAASRNIGLNHCSGTLVLQTDDDARPFPDWVRKLTLLHEQFPQAGVIGGEVVDDSGKGLLVAVADAITFPWYPDTREVRNVPGVNSSYKIELIRELGSYDTNLFRGEDVDYNWRALRAGWKVLYSPEAKVYHKHRSTWKGLLNQHYMYGRAYFLVRTKWPDMYSVYPRKLKSPKDLLKGIYFFLSPIHNSFLRLSRVRGGFNKILAFIPMLMIGYAWMTGFFVQILKRRNYEECESAEQEHRMPVMSGKSIDKSLIRSNEE